jgi:hypothetical protein
MAIIVEPTGGAELERLITALLNATGAVHQVIGTELGDPTIDRLEVIARAAARLRAILAVIAEESGFADAFRFEDRKGRGLPDLPDDGHADWV